MRTVLESRVMTGKIVTMGKWRPSLICPGEIGSDIFRGMTKFKMGVYWLNFKEMELRCYNGNEYEISCIMSSF